MLSFRRLIKQKNGFTLIEIMVAISVIGILASIGIVSYNGYRSSVIATQLKSDLNGVATTMENARNFDGTYPTNVPSNFIASEDTVLTGGSPDGSVFCIDATSTKDGSIKYYIDETTSNSGAQAGDCASRPVLGGATCEDTDRYGTYPDCYDYDSLPIATSISGYWTTAPAGYLLEDGSAVSCVTYADLYDAIYDGTCSNTFNLPDSRGRLSVNRNSSDADFDNVGEKSGSKTHTLSIAQMPSHNHGGGSFSTTSHGHGISGWTNALNYPDGRDSYDETNEQEVANIGHIHPYSGWTSAPSSSASVASQGSGGAHNNIQPSIVKTYAIKYAESTGSFSKMPMGTSIQGYWKTGQAPSGYHLEDGSAVSCVTYADLYAILYGGTCGGTFNLPDSRGRVAINLDATDGNINGIGKKYGEKDHILSLTEIPSHNHGSTFATNNHQHSYSGTTGTLNYPAGRDSYDETNEQEAANIGHVHTYSGWTGVTDHGAQSVAYQGGGQGHTEVQPSIVKVFAIKMTGPSGEVDSLPKGTTVQGYFVTAPEGYLLENGSSVSCETYADLYNVLYSGTCSGSFNLPNSSGYAIVARNSSDADFGVIGGKVGSKTVTLTVTSLPSHNHNSTFASSGHTHTYSFWTGTLNYPAGKDSLDETNEQEGANTSHVHPMSGTTSGPNATAGLTSQGSGSAHNNMQQSIVQSFAIKY